MLNFSIQIHCIPTHEGVENHIFTMSNHVPILKEVRQIYREV